MCVLLDFVVVCWVGCWFLSLGKFVFNHRLILVLDRPCLALVRQCRKKKKHLDRVLAGCCWEVQATRTTPSESLLSLYQVAKCLTMKLAVHLAKEIAALLRAVLAHETQKLYNDSTVHLLCSNYWIQPVYQELLHSSSRYNATREGERKRPSSGLARVAAYPKPPKQRKPSASGTSFSDWIGGTCHADTLQVWFSAHWAPVVLQQLQQKEDNYRAENPSWMDQEEARGHSQAMARSTGKPTYAVQGWQLSRWFLGEQHLYANRHH